MAAAIVITVIVVAAWPGEKEPEYQGKKLSEWAEPYASLAEEISQERQDLLKNEDADAIRHMGTNALPFLLKWTREKPPHWRKQMAAIGRKMPYVISRYNSPASWIYGDPGFSRPTAAAWAFWVLGSQASPAVPELTRIASDVTAPEVSQRAVFALGHIGKDGFGSLLAILSNPQQAAAVRARAAWFVSRDYMGTNSILAVPLLIQSLNDLDPFLEMVAADGLGDLALQPDSVVPALTVCLQGIYPPPVRRAASDALGKFGPRAKAAVPALLKVARETPPVLGLFATNALRKIAPEVLTNEANAGHF